MLAKMKRKEYRREDNMACKELFQNRTGSKKNLCNSIMDLVDDSKTLYVEPYVGGGALALRAPYNKKIINDKDIKVAALYEILRRDKLNDQFINEVLNLEKNKDVYLEMKAKLKEIDINTDLKNVSDNELLEFCIPAFYVQSTSFNRSMNGFCYLDDTEAWRRKTFWALYYMKNMMTQENVEITCRDAVDVINDYKDRDDTQFVIDSPYVGLYRGSRRDYSCEMDKLYEHFRLIDNMKDIKGSAIICGFRPSVNSGIPCIYDAVLNECVNNKWKCFNLKSRPNRSYKISKLEMRYNVQEYVWVNYENENTSFAIDSTNVMESYSLDEYWDIIINMIGTGKIDDVSAKEYANTYMKYRREIIKK